MSAEQTPDIAAVLAEHAQDLSSGPFVIGCCCGESFPSDEAHRAHVAAALAPVLAAAVREGKAEALRVVRLVEQDMAEQAYMAWRSADARRGLADHDALLVHADALTRWSERLRMAFDGEDYRADRIAGDAPGGEGS